MLESHYQVQRDQGYRRRDIINAIKHERATSVAQPRAS